MSTQYQQPNILIFGKNGQVGYELNNILPYIGNVSAIDIDECDLTDPSSIRENLDRYRPNIILNGAAYTAVDKAENEAELAKKLNSTAPGVMADWGAKHKALMVHFSTDYVFDGTKKEGWLETDTPNPLNVYGKTKLDGDLNIQNSGCDHLIFRTSWVYGARGKNFYLTMKKLLQEKEEIKVVNDQFGAPTWCRTIATGVALILSQITAPNTNKECSQLSGTYNLTNQGETTWFDFTTKIKSHMEKQHLGLFYAKLVPVTTQEYGVTTIRPKYSKLNCDKLLSTFGLTPPLWTDTLELVSEQCR